MFDYEKEIARLKKLADEKEVDFDDIFMKSQDILYYTFNYPPGEVSSWGFDDIKKTVEEINEMYHNGNLWVGISKNGELGSNLKEFLDSELIKIIENRIHNF
ncbi:MAG: hypothetical protein LBM02_09685 [Lachnospiraceae bacterium]|jgi:hypothetical protein|nr:hypothetical protein [Lachnospiraceae bacterium]